MILLLRRFFLRWWMWVVSGFSVRSGFSVLMGLCLFCLWFFLVSMIRFLWRIGVLIGWWSL